MLLFLHFHVTWHTQIFWIMCHCAFTQADADLAAADPDSLYPALLRAERARQIASVALHTCEQRQDELLHPVTVLIRSN